MSAEKNNDPTHVRRVLCVLPPHQFRLPAMVLVCVAALVWIWRDEGFVAWNSVRVLLLTPCTGDHDWPL